jgi:hypothetical protein
LLTADAAPDTKESSISTGARAYFRHSRNFACRSRNAENLPCSCSIISRSSPTDRGLGSPTLLPGPTFALYRAIASSHSFANSWLLIERTNKGVHESFLPGNWAMSWGLAEAGISLSGRRSSHGTAADCGRNSYLRPYRDNERISAGMKLAFLPTQVSF